MKAFWIFVKRKSSWILVEWKSWIFWLNENLHESESNKSLYGDLIILSPQFTNREIEKDSKHLSGIGTQRHPCQSKKKKSALGTKCAHAWICQQNESAAFVRICPSFSKLRLFCLLVDEVLNLLPLLRIFRFIYLGNPC